MRQQKRLCIEIDHGFYLLWTIVDSIYHILINKCWLWLHSIKKTIPGIPSISHSVIETFNEPIAIINSIVASCRYRCRHHHHRIALLEFLCAHVSQNQLPIFQFQIVESCDRTQYYWLLCISLALHISIFRNHQKINEIIFVCTQSTYFC